MINNIINIELTRNLALQIIRECSKDSSRVVFRPHARQRMSERGITDKQVLRCLEIGSMTEEPHRDTSQRWVCAMEHYTAGDRIKVVVGFDTDDQGHKVIVVTTMTGR